MKITILDRYVVCTLDNPNRDFIKAVFGGIDYENLKVINAIKSDVTSEWEIRTNYKFLNFMLAWANIYSIEVDTEVLELKTKWEKDIEEFDRIHGEINAKWFAMEKWQWLKKYGCWKCKNRRHSALYEDCFICEKLNKELPTYNIGLGGEKPEVGKFYGINAVFCLAPFPSDDCPFKTDDLDKNNPEYIEWKENQILSGF